MTVESDFMAFCIADQGGGAITGDALPGQAVVATVARAVTHLVAAHAELRTASDKRPSEGSTRDDITAAVVPYLSGLPDWLAQRLALEAIAYAVDARWIKPVVRERPGTRQSRFMGR